MFGVFEVKELESKRKALAAESEVYRETLKLEARNMALYAKYLKVKSSRAPFEYLKFLPAVATLFFRRKKPKGPRFLTTALLGWQVYNRVLPFCRAMFGTRNRPIETSRIELDARVPDL